MALIDKASLLMVPSTYEAGKLYNVLPSGNRAPDSTDQNSGYDQTRADFDFDRGSNTAASRINSSGLIEKYRENLLLQSNNFGTTWTNTNTTETGGQSGYDGSSNAWLLTKTASSFARIQQPITSTSGVKTFSVYLKAGTLSWCRVLALSSSSPECYINLSNGSLGSQYDNITATSTDVGNGWYRVSLVFNDTISEVRIYPADANNSVSGISGNILIQNAQLETGLVATDYLNSTSVTGKAGVLVDLPRINYDANGENGSLILEPSRQQLIQYSEYFSTASGYWINVRSTIETNSTTSPEGLNNASKILQDSTTTNAGVIVKSITASGSNTFSFFAKKGSVNFARLSLNSGTETSAYFDLENGEIGTTNSISESDCFIEDMGNDWYRCGATYSGATNRFNIYLGDRDGITTLLDASNAYIYIYGAQWEANATYPSSYIPNHGESGGVTRAADSCSVTGVSDVIGQTEGTLFVELGEMNTAANDDVFIELSDGTTNNRILIYNDSSGDIRNQIKASGAISSSINTNVTIASNQKIAITYATNEAKVFINGVQYGSTDTSVVVPSVSKISLSNFTDVIAQTRTLKQALVFDSKLTDAECISLTS